MRRGVRQIAHAFALSATLACACGAACARQSEASGDGARLREVLARVGESVERYHAGLFGLAFGEALRLEELREDMTPKRSREFDFDCVVVREELSKEQGDYYAETVRRL